MNQDLDITIETVEAGGTLALVIWLALMILTIAGCWKSFTKAGQPGWAAIIPVYNLYVFLKIAGSPVWWLILFFIPVLNLVFYIIVTVAFADKFGKGAGFAVGLLLLPIIFYPVLGFGGSRYLGREAPDAAEPA